VSGMFRVPQPISVLVVDSQPVVREGCRSVLHDTADIQVLAEAEDKEAACAAYATARPDVVLLELRDHGLEGLETIRRLKAQDPSACILMFSSHDDEAMIIRVMQAGAQGFLAKTRDLTHLVSAIRALANGETRIDSSRATELLSAVIAGIPAGPLGALSRREHQLFQQFAEGQSTLEIAVMFSISPKTVAVHHAAINKKLGLNNITQLVRLAIRCDVIEA
jgi:two-component system invasion response regulator UvrY